MIMFEAYGRNWLQFKICKRKKDFLVDYKLQECDTSVWFVADSSCRAHYLVLQVCWVEWHGAVTFVREVIFPREVTGAGKEF